jgi:pimeloyl-ACP methyl ester carboxylesterase
MIDPSSTRVLDIDPLGAGQGVRALTRTSAEQIVRANGVDLCAQTFGDPADPAILLIHGAATSMLGWPEAFCESLADAGRFVIRYDHRDTGRSVSYEPGAPPYSLPDLAEDAVGLLDAFGLDRAHLVGRSMGGGLAMLVALDHTDRVASLTLIGASPGGPGLPPMSEEFLAHVSGTKNPDWSDREAVIGHMLDFPRVISVDPEPYDAPAWRDAIARDVDRTVNIVASQINHFVMDVGAPIRDRLGEIAAPTLVIHGEEDPVFPLGHGIALAREIPGAELLTLERTGHDLPPEVWDVVIPAIIQHTARAEQSAPRAVSSTV